MIAVLTPPSRDRTCCTAIGPYLHCIFLYSFTATCTPITGCSSGQVNVSYSTTPGRISAAAVLPGYQSRITT